ncbi:histidine kinase (plasmid) [Deinococcus taeanensis]|uniref:sensor histidine kinase n=1 Tax=Deinococcus taeanensis TaxID=2737050 RepID=UPI001CDC2A13|nr:ATP-binding protein [Deinococcus taeanensis]UBV44533.1 histidine kinase [Deinococcus taeanensis]
MTADGSSTPLTEHTLFDQGGEMGALLREYDWTQSPLGAPGTWSPRLRTYVELMLASKQPMYIGWTHDLLAFYNDAYRPILGADKHPGALGRPTAAIFGRDGYPGLKPYFDALLERGEAFAFENILVPLIRHGYLEECYFDASYTPIHGDGRVERMLATVNETTDRVLGNRRTETLAHLAAQLLRAGDAAQITTAVMDSVQTNPADLPFALLYLTGARQALTYQAGVGLEDAALASFHQIPDAWRQGDDLDILSIPPQPASPWPEPVTQVAVLPLVERGTAADRLGVLVVGLNARKQVNAPYRDFLELFRSQVTGALRTADLTGVLLARTQALEAFVQLSRDMMAETDRFALVRRAQEIVLSLLPEGYAVYYELEEGLWRVKAQVGDLGDDRLQTLVTAGLPFDSPTLLTPFRSGEPFYQDVYAQGADTPVEVVQHVQAVVTLPVQVQGRTVGLFALGLFHQRTWTAVDRAVLDTTVHSLSLALERAGYLGQLTAQRDTLDAQTRALGDANEELEAFAYSVSHDLRTPVRHIAGFSSVLRKSLGDSPNEKTLRSLTVIEQAAYRMNSLIDAMLELSRTSRQPLLLRLVDLGAVLADVRAELVPDLLEREISWQIGPLPLVLGDQDLLRLALLNLISNALKYSQHRALTVIEVKAVERPDHWVLEIRDNGVGFDPAHASRLFGVFQRLHRQEDFEGTGVGLANVRRIVLRHGGEVWASGAVDQGATFSISLPKAKMTARPG